MGFDNFLLIFIVVLWYGQVSAAKNSQLLQSLDDEIIILVKVIYLKVSFGRGFGPF